MKFVVSKQPNEREEFLSYFQVSFCCGRLKYLVDRFLYFCNYSFFTELKYILRLNVFTSNSCVSVSKEEFMLTLNKNCLFVAFTNSILILHHAGFSDYIVDASKAKLMRLNKITTAKFIHSSPSPSTDKISIKKSLAEITC